MQICDVKKKPIFNISLKDISNVAIISDKEIIENEKVSTPLTKDDYEDIYAKFNVKKIVKIPNQELYTVYCPYCVFVKRRVNNGSVINEIHFCNILHIVYDVDTFTSIGILFHFFLTFAIILPQTI